MSREGNMQSRAMRVVEDWIAGEGPEGATIREVSQHLRAQRNQDDGLQGIGAQPPQGPSKNPPRGAKAEIPTAPAQPFKPLTPPQVAPPSQRGK